MLFNLMELDLKLYCLALEFLCLIILGECYINCKFLACLMTDNLILKAGDKCTAAECKAVVFCCTALKCFTVKQTLEVDNSDIFIFSSLILNGNKTAVSLLNLLYFLFNILICYFERYRLILKTLITVYRNLRLNCDNCLEYKTVLACFFDIKVNLILDHFKTCFICSSNNCCGIKILDCILIEHALSVFLFDKSSRCLTLSETGDIDLLDFSFIYSINCLHKSFAVDLNNEFIAVCFNLV